MIERIRSGDARYAPITDGRICILSQREAERSCHTYVTGGTIQPMNVVSDVHFVDGAHAIIGVSTPDGPNVFFGTEKRRMFSSGTEKLVALAAYRLAPDVLWSHEIDTFNYIEFVRTLTLFRRGGNQCDVDMALMLTSLINSIDPTTRDASRLREKLEDALAWATWLAARS